MKTQVELKFTNFHEQWMAQLEALLQVLILVSNEHPPESVYIAAINKLTTHHKEFYTFKWATAHDDILSVFNPVWLAPLENANLWVTGWKPSSVFRLVHSLRTGDNGGSLARMSEDQVKMIDALRMKMKNEEERVEREMERQQVALADRKMVELVRKDMQEKGNAKVVAEVAKAVKGIFDGLEKVMKMADCVRLKTLKGILDLLTPMQSVDFLAANSRVMIQMRKFKGDNKSGGK